MICSFKKSILLQWNPIRFLKSDKLSTGYSNPELENIIIFTSLKFKNPLKFGLVFASRFWYLSHTSQIPKDIVNN